MIRYFLTFQWLFCWYSKLKPSAQQPDSQPLRGDGRPPVAPQLPQPQSTLPQLPPSSRVNALQKAFTQTQPNFYGTLNLNYQETLIDPHNHSRTRTMERPLRATDARPACDVRVVVKDHGMESLMRFIAGPSPSSQWQQRLTQK